MCRVYARLMLWLLFMFPPAYVGVVFVYILQRTLEGEGELVSAALLAVVAVVRRVALLAVIVVGRAAPRCWWW